MTPPRRILISVKYNHDQIVERSLSAYLKSLGYVTYRHEGTVDYLKRVDLPPIVTYGPATMIAPHPSLAGRHAEGKAQAEDVSAPLIRYLIEQVCSHPLVVIVWSAAYFQSFLCVLEMKAALVARKPLVVVCSDYHPLPDDVTKEMGRCQCEIVEIDDEYATSKVAAVIDRIFPIMESPADSHQVHCQLEPFVVENCGRGGASPGFLPADAKRYQRIVQGLRAADEQGYLHATLQRLIGIGDWEYPEDQGRAPPAIQRIIKMIQGMSASGENSIDVGLRRYLECAAQRVIDAPLEEWYYTYLLGEILDHVFLPPSLPRRMEQFYVERIRTALTPAEIGKVQDLIEGMVRECLYTREFIEYFGHLLGEVTSTDGPSVAKAFWQLCISRVSELV